MKYGALTHEQARFFRSQGYYRLPNVFSRDETAQLREFIATESTRQHQASAHLGSKTLKLYGLYDRNPDLMHATITKPALVSALESILGPNIVFVKNRHNHATVNDHHGEPPEGLHRDVLQPSRGLITAAVYLQEATAANGATRVIPGSQEFPYVGVPQVDGGGTWLAAHEEYDGLEDQALSVPMPEGGVLLFTGLAFHGIGANTSGHPRMSMTLGFRSADELDAQPDNMRQVLVTGQYIYRGNDI